MKKLVLVLLAMFLVIPALSNAGSVSSRYDVTFGGFVKYDMGWSSQNNHADPGQAGRSSQQWDNRADEFGNTFAAAGESRFNFLVKGPDLWGAKTSAFIEGDFRGVTTGNAYGGFQLRHAFMTLKWDSLEIMMGQNWQQWGMPYYGAMIGNNDFAQYLKGIRTPQATIRWFPTKEFNVMFGLTSATEWGGATRQWNDDYARSSWPGLQSEIAYWTDRCGKIGPNNLKFALGAYYGRESKTYATYDATTDHLNWRDDTIDAWITAFRYSIPIIPEKQGNKQWALLLNGNFFIGQNVGGNNWMSPGAPSPSNGSYWRVAAAGGPDAAAPTLFGLYTQGTLWLTNTLQFNAMYGYLKYNYSSGARDQMPDNINMMQTYAANLLWDANQAIRFGFQWMTMFTGYNRDGMYPTSANYGLSRTGQIDQYRFAAWYFF